LAFRRLGGWAYRYPLDTCPDVHILLVYDGNVLTPGVLVFDVMPALGCEAIQGLTSDVQQSAHEPALSAHPLGSSARPMMSLLTPGSQPDFHAQGA
jgi:hypothetical protein